jgi:hypothetical protein
VGRGRNDRRNARNGRRPENVAGRSGSDAKSSKRRKVVPKDARKPVPVRPERPDDDPAYINASMLKSSRYGSIAAGIVAVLAALPPILGGFVEAFGYGDKIPFPPGLIYAATAFASVCVIAGAVLVSTDLRVRGDAKTATIDAFYGPDGAFDADQDGSEVPADLRDEEAVYEPPAGVVPTAERFAVKLHDGEHRLLVLAIGSDPETGATTFLVGEPGEKPYWVEESEVQAAFYRTDPAQFHQIG